MKFVFSNLIILFFTFQAHSQLSESDLNLLRTELILQVNHLRDSLGLSSLQTDPSLKNAAQNQGDYMATNQVLTHEQKTRVSKTPSDRVKIAGGVDWERIGENCLYTVPQHFPLKAKDIKSIAYSMFLQWKNSPPHYLNMIDPDYTHGDFGFAVDPKTNAIYAAQVFGRKGIKIPGQFSEDAFGIQWGEDKRCDDFFGAKKNFITNMGNAIVIEDNEIILKHHDITKVQMILGQPTDGLMIDLVWRDQFACGEPNQLDISPIYDGVLLKPVYYNDLINNNTALSEYRLVTSLGIIPEEVQGKDFSYSLIVIKDGLACAYAVPAYIPYEPYEQVFIEPRLISEQSYALSDTGIIYSEQLNFEFERGETKASNKPMTPSDNNRKPYAVELVAYTSIEGDSVSNLKIGEGRADFMLNYVNRFVQTNPQQVDKLVAENWNYFYFQLELAGLGSMLRLEKDSLRKFVMSDSLRDWNSMLFDQRRSFAVIHYLGVFDERMLATSPAEMNFRQALLQDDWVTANNALHACYMRRGNADFLFEDAILVHLIKHPELVQNAAALMTRFYQHEIYKAISFTGYWMSHFDELTADAKFNLLILYNLTTKKLLDVWDIRSQTLARVMHPSKAEKWMLATSHPELLLNYHIAAIQYYGLINHVPGMSKSFDFIADHFKNSLLSIEDEVKLCLFFNSWSRYDLTIDFLHKRINDSDFNEEAAFVLAHTAYAYPYNLDETELFLIFKRALGFNSERWCEWLQNDFQVLRNQAIKSVYCDVCP